MTSKEGMQSKISIKENGVLSFTSKDNGNTFFKLFFKLSRFTAAEISTSKKKKTTGEYYKHIRNKCEGFVLHNVDVTTVDEILKNLNVTKASEIYQISAKFLKKGAPVIAIYLANIKNCQ